MVSTLSRGLGALQSRTTSLLLAAASELSTVHADGGASDTTIATAIQVDVRTVERIRKRCSEEGVHHKVGAKRKTDAKH